MGLSVDLSVANESMQQELTCPVCNKGYELPLEEVAKDRRPRVLPCLHTGTGHGGGRGGGRGGGQEQGEVKSIVAKNVLTFSCSKPNKKRFFYF